MTRCTLIERSLIKKFRKPIWNRFIEAVQSYELIESGDKIAVCISGGKDSFLLAKPMQELCRHGHTEFSLEFICMDPGYSPANRKRIEENSALMEIPVKIFESDIFAAVENIEQSPCYLCARMRRGCLYSKAKELGCQNSNFVNSHGLHDDEHYTSARDMALIGSACFQNADFMRITGTREYTIPTTNVTDETRTIAQHHKMLFTWRDQYYEYCVGGKTGYTDKALNTLVTLASKDGMNLVAVVLRTHGTGNTYNDTRAMLDYAFENFSKVPVTDDMVEVSGLQSIDKEAYITLPSGITFEQLDCTVENPTDLGDKSGKLIYTYEGQPMGEIEFTITDEFYNEIHGIEEIKEDYIYRKNNPDTDAR